MCVLIVFPVSSDGLDLETYVPRSVENETESEWETRCQNLKTLRLCLHGNNFWSTRPPPLDAPAMEYIHTSRFKQKKKGKKILTVGCDRTSC